MAEFFGGRGAGHPGLAVFLNAGDPPMAMLGEIAHMLDESGVDCLELAVPFPHSATDGPVVRRSADRALDLGTDLATVLAFVAKMHGTLRRLRIALLVDWSATIRPIGMSRFLDSVAAADPDGLLVHAVPPGLRPSYYDAARARNLPIVTSCYHGFSSAQVRTEACAHASAYLYLVSRYGRSGVGATIDGSALAATISLLRKDTAAPIAVGFGITDRAGIAAVGAAGADGAVIGSAVVRRIEQAALRGTDVVSGIAEFIGELMNPHWSHERELR